MKTFRPLQILFALLLASCVLPSAQEPITEDQNQPAPVIPAIPQVDAPALPQAQQGQGLTFQPLGTVTRDQTQAAQNPALTIGTVNAGTPAGLWVTWSENSSASVRQIFVSELVGEALQARGASLNIHANVIADFPSITFAGENNLVPWVAWAEPSPGFGNLSQIFASRFNASSGLWQQAGQDRGGGEASLNFRTSNAASHPFIFSGSTALGQPSVPWVAWEEVGGNTSANQIFVAKGVKDDSGDARNIGGFLWEFVGQIREEGEPTLNVDRFRNSVHPTGVFAETGNSVPWVTWHETGRERPSRIFTARGVVDANAPGGLKWINVPDCGTDETACALNINPLKDAKDASMAAGSLTAGEATVPWIAWPEIGPTGKWQIFVSRLDTNTRNGFLQVGASLNVDPNHDARSPYIVFAGNIPYVVWLEDDGTGIFKIQVRHLASDPQTGTWALDTPANGFTANPVHGLAAVASSDTIFMAWVEGDPAATASQLVIGKLLVGSGQP